MKYFHLSFLFTVCTFVPASAATVYVDDAVIGEAVDIYGPSGGIDGRIFTLTASQNGFLVAKVITVTTGTEFGFNGHSIAGNYDIFSVIPGTEFTYQNAASNPSLLSWTATFTNTLNLTDGQSSYIGYWSQFVPNSTPQAIDIFGWAKVTVSGGELIVEESASARGGIIVGTLTAIPEPSSLLLLSASALPLLRRRRPALA